MRTRLGLLVVVLGAVVFGGSIWLLWSGRVTLNGTAEPAHTTSATANLPSCDKAFARIVVPVQAEWAQVITDYFATQELAVTEIAPTATLLDVELQRIGEHRCVYPDGGQSAWTGSVPMGAIAAVQVQVTHDPYPVTGGTGSFVTLASSGAGWSVVGEGTGP